MSIRIEKKLVKEYNNLKHRLLSINSSSNPTHLTEIIEAQAGQLEKSSKPLVKRDISILSSSDMPSEMRNAYIVLPPSRRNSFISMCKKKLRRENACA